MSLVCKAKHTQASGFWSSLEYLAVFVCWHVARDNILSACNSISKPGHSRSTKQMLCASPWQGVKNNLKNSYMSICNYNCHCS